MREGPKDDKSLDEERKREIKKELSDLKREAPVKKALEANRESERSKREAQNKERLRKKHEALVNYAKYDPAVPAKNKLQQKDSISVHDTMKREKAQTEKELGDLRKGDHMARAKAKLSKRGKT